MPEIKKWSRRCPECNDIIWHSEKRKCNKARNEGKLCKSCAKTGRRNYQYGRFGELSPTFGKTFTDDHKNKISKALIGKIRTTEHSQNISKSLKGKCTGENHPMYGRSVYSVWEEKYGKEEADKRQQITREKISKAISGRKFYEEQKREKRLARLKEIEEKHGQVMPNYNPVACKIIEKFNRFGYNFRHAENGGEVCIDGYFPDAFDEKRKLIVEFDENYHYDSSGNLRQKDKDRQKYLEGLEYTVIRMMI